MMTNVFVYGFLADERVLFLITRLAARLREAKLPDFEETRGDGRQPTVRRAPGCTVDGLVAVEVPEAYVQRLEGFLGPEYIRIEANIIARGERLRASVYQQG
jgi:hypothetical protein